LPSSGGKAVGSIPGAGAVDRFGGGRSSIGIGFSMPRVSSCSLTALIAPVMWASKMEVTRRAIREQAVADEDGDLSACRVESDWMRGDSMNEDSFSEITLLGGAGAGMGDD
jgi:hypothetical protein